MTYGQDALAQIYANAEQYNTSLYNDSKSSINIHKEVTGDTISTLNAQNERLGDAITDIQNNKTNSNTRTNSAVNNNNAQKVNSSLISPDEEVSVLFEDVENRQKNYGETGNKIYDFLDALGESDEDFDLLNLFANEDTFEDAYEQYGSGDLDHEDFLDFDFSQLGDDLGFEIDFNKEKSTLSLFFHDTDTGYHFSDDENGGAHAKTDGGNNAASSPKTKKSNSANSKGKKKGHFKQKIKYSGNAQGNKKTKKIFKNIAEKASDNISNFGKKIFNFFKSMAKSHKEENFGKLFSDKNHFQSKWNEHGDGTNMNHEDFKNHDFSELDQDLGVEIRFNENQAQEAELSINYTENTQVESDDNDVEYEEVEVEDNDNEPELVMEYVEEEVPENNNQKKDLDDNDDVYDD